MLAVTSGSHEVSRSYLSVTIDDGAVIGANAVVTHGVAEDSIVAGVPAKPLPGRRSE
jgi:acetyltransferase-like isoleucine patch superfamily enzyme